MREIRQVPVRLPAEMKSWLMEQAVRNGSSQNSEVIRAVRERMERVSKDQVCALHLETNSAFR